jgi:hypothetical protein
LTFDLRYVILYIENKTKGVLKMKVYVVEMNGGFDCWHNVGVFSTFEKAKDCIREEVKWYLDHKSGYNKDAIKECMEEFEECGEIECIVYIEDFEIDKVN